MDNTHKRKYRIDPIGANTIMFYAPRELVERNDILVCIEYKTRQVESENICVDYNIWSRFRASTSAEIVFHSTTCIRTVCGPTVALEEMLLNEVLHTASAVRAIQKFANTKLVGEECDAIVR